MAITLIFRLSGDVWRFHQSFQVELSSRDDTVGELASQQPDHLLQGVEKRDQSGNYLLDAKSLPWRS